jgi:hypothetical protein
MSLEQYYKAFERLKEPEDLKTLFEIHAWYL